MEPSNRFQGMNLASLAGRYNNPIPTWFLALIDCLNFPALSANVCITPLLMGMDEGFIDIRVKIDGSSP
jgi:hypothetical protein